MPVEGPHNKAHPLCKGRMTAGVNENPRVAGRLANLSGGFPVLVLTNPDNEVEASPGIEPGCKDLQSSA